MYVIEIIYNAINRIFICVRIIHTRSDPCIEFYCLHLVCNASNVNRFVNDIGAARVAGRGVCTVYGERNRCFGVNTINSNVNRKGIRIHLVDRSRTRQNSRVMLALFLNVNNLYNSAVDVFGTRIIKHLGIGINVEQCFSKLHCSVDIRRTERAIVVNTAIAKVG